MTGRLLTAGITLFWLAMMGLLAHREILPAYRAAREAAQRLTYSRLQELASEPRVSQMGIYLGKRRVGKTVSVVRMVDDELRIRSETELNIRLSPGPSLGPTGEGLRAAIRFCARAALGRLLEFRLTVSSPPGTPPAAIVDGYPVGRSLVLKIRQSGTTTTRTIPFDSEQLLSDSLSPALAPGDLRLGRRWVIRTLDPTTYTIRSVWAEVVRREPVTLDGETTDAYLIEVPYGSQKVKVWADRNGEVLKQKVLGFTFIREEVPADVRKALLR